MKTSLLLLDFNQDEINKLLGCSNSVDININPEAVMTQLKSATDFDSNENVILAVISKNSLDPQNKTIIDEALAKKVKVMCLQEQFSTSDHPFKECIMSSADLSDTVCHKILSGLVPEGFKSICVKASRFIGEKIFPGIEMEFKEIDAIKISHNISIFCELVDKSIVSSFMIRADLEAFKKRDPLYKEIADDVWVDSFQEFANQYMGSINFNLAQIEGLAPRGGVPISFLKSSSGKKTSLFFRPSFFLSNAPGDIQIKIDFARIKPVDLTKLQSRSFIFSEPEEAAEFF